MESLSVWNKMNTESFINYFAELPHTISDTVSTFTPANTQDKRTTETKTLHHLNPNVVPFMGYTPPLRKEQLEPMEDVGVNSREKRGAGLGVQPPR